MSEEFRNTSILLMQHPVMYKPYDELSNDELRRAYDLSRSLTDFLVDENYTLLDYVQMARIQFLLGQLAYNLGEDEEKTISYFRIGFQYLDKGGIDLSINKWAELMSIRSKE